MKKHYLKNYIVAFGVASSFCFFPSTTAKAGPSKNPSALNLLYNFFTNPDNSFVRRTNDGKTSVRFLYSDNTTTTTSRLTIPQSSVIFTQTDNGENIKLVEGGKTKQTVSLQTNQSVYIKTLTKNGDRKIITIKPTSTSLTITSKKINNENEDETKVTKFNYPSDQNPNGSFEQDIHKNSRTDPSLQTRYYTRADGFDPSLYKIFTETKNSNGINSRYESKDVTFETYTNSNGTVLQNTKFSNGNTETTYTTTDGVTVVTSNNGDKFTRSIFNPDSELISKFVSTPSGYEETTFNIDGSIKLSYKVTNH